MSKNIPLCAICLLGVIAVVSFGFVYLIVHHHKPCKNGECLVKIDLGHLRGRERETILAQKTFYSFQGIPYAKPPVGPLRFKDPEAMDHWHTVIDATEEGSICLQRTSSKGTIGSENCLYLNVYTSQFPDHDITRHPVMVYFHGGGFNYGSAEEFTYGPDYLIEFDVVVVTVQYRLGALGFLSLGNDDIPGNAGLKDQVLALEWVKKHIGHFGGDPDSVTIFGTSAGAASVQYHMLSPLSKGLFHNAIMFSGSVLNPWAFDEYPVQKAFNLGKLLGNDTSDPEELANFLRLIPAEDIAQMQYKIKTDKDRMRCISFPFMPSVEKPATNSFLTENPKIILETGKFTRVPTIIGVTKKEGLVAYYRSDLLTYFNDDVSRFVPPDLHLETNSVQFQDVERRIRESYFRNMPLSLKQPDDFIDICSDVEFVLGLQKSIDYFLKNSSVPVFVEKFTFVGKFGFASANLHERWPSLYIPEGPTHGEETSYYFFNRNSANITDADNEIKIVKLLTSILSSFATYHNPTQDNDLIWKQTEENNPSYLVIGSSTQEVTDTLLSKEKIEFWDNIYRIATT